MQGQHLGQQGGTFFSHISRSIKVFSWVTDTIKIGPQRIWPVKWCVSTSLLHRGSLWKIFWILGGRAGSVFPLPRPTAKKPLRSKQHERGLCGGGSVSPLPRPTAKKPLRWRQHERGLCGRERVSRQQLNPRAKGSFTLWHKHNRKHKHKKMEKVPFLVLMLISSCLCNFASHILSYFSYAYVYASA